MMAPHRPRVVSIPDPPSFCLLAVSSQLIHALLLLTFETYSLLDLFSYIFHGTLQEDFLFFSGEIFYFLLALEQFEFKWKHGCKVYVTVP